MTVCGVAAEGDLPEMWRLIPQYGKKDRMAVEFTLKQTAQHTGLAYRTPIITLVFAKRLLSLNFTSNYPNSLSQGVQSCPLVIVDHRRQQSREAM
jgi:hypothetical protein